MTLSDPGPAASRATDVTRTLVNGLALLGSNVVTSGAQYVIVVIVARALGPETFGAYLLAFTFAAFFATLCNFGLDRVLIRDIVRQPAAASASLLAAAGVRLLLGALSGAVAVVAAWGLGYSPSLRLVIALLLLAQILGLFSELCRSVLFAFGAMPREAVLRAAGRCVSVAAVAAALVMQWSLAGVAAALAIGGLVELLLYATAMARRLALRPTPVDWDVARGLVRSAWPIALNTVLVVLYLRINVVMLTSWTGAEAAGVFGAAFTFVQVLQVVSGTLAGVLLPTLTARKLQGHDQVLAAVRSATYYVLLFVLPATVGMSLLSGELVAFVYGAQYAGAASALSVLAWANPFMFLGSLYGTLLIVLDAERTLIPVSAAALAVSGAANYLFVPSFGPAGAAWASVLTELAVAMSVFWGARHRLGRIGVAAILIRPVLVAGAVGAVLQATETANGPWRVLAAVAVFALGVLAAEVVFADAAAVRLLAWRRGAQR